MADLDPKAVRAACMANFHPDTEPSSVEMDKMRRSIRAYLAALPKGGPVAWRWRSNFGSGWMPWADGPAPDDTNATPEAKDFWKSHERQEVAAPPAGDEQKPTGLEQLRDLSDRSTAGPWKITSAPGGWDAVKSVKWGSLICHLDEQHTVNAEFIAAAVNFVRNALGEGEK